MIEQEIKTYMLKDIQLKCKREQNTCTADVVVQVSDQPKIETFFRNLD